MSSILGNINKHGGTLKIIPNTIKCCAIDYCSILHAIDNLSNIKNQINQTQREVMIIDRLSRTLRIRGELSRKRLNYVMQYKCIAVDRMFIYLD